MSTCAGTNSLFYPSRVYNSFDAVSRSAFCLLLMSAVTEYVVVSTCLALNSSISSLAMAIFSGVV